MAKLVSHSIFGVDVAKDNLVICNWGDVDRIDSISNNEPAIKRWLKSLPLPARIAVEPTSTYHLAVVELAIKFGCEVYLIGTRQLAHYRNAVGERNKTDPADAYLLARYLDREVDMLRPFQLRPDKAQRLWGLIKRRAAVVQARTKLKQSLGSLDITTRGLFTQFEQTIKRIEKYMVKLIKQLGWKDDFDRCRSIPGIGQINAMALTATYHRGAFSNVDAFISFMGLDVRLRESGRFKGKRKLTKYGESEIRRLIYCAAKPSRSYALFDKYYQRQIEKGLPKTAANIILGRKLARIAFALMRNQVSFTRNDQPCVEGK